MKKILSMVLFAAVLLSCNDQSLELAESQAKADLKGSRNTGIDPYAEIPFYITLPNTTTSTERRYLTFTGAENLKWIRTAPKNETNIEDQLWYLERTTENSDLYRIKSYANQELNEIFSQRRPNNPNESIFTFPFNEQLWEVQDVPGSHVIKKLHTSTIPNFTSSYLRFDATLPLNIAAADFNPINAVDFNWTMQAHGDFQFQNITYTSNNSDIEEIEQPGNSVPFEYSNSTPDFLTHLFDFRIPSRYRTRFEEVVVPPFNYSKESFSVNVPTVRRTHVDTDNLSNNIWAYITFPPNADLVFFTDFNVPITIPPHSKIIGNAILVHYASSADYIIEYRHKDTGRLMTVTGIWEGFNSGDLRLAFDIIDLNNNSKKTITTTYKPGETIDLTK